jgi:hypothetical protein
MIKFAEYFSSSVFWEYNVVKRWCVLQLRMIPLGLKNLKIPSVEERKKVFDERNAKVPEGKRKFTKGMLEFEELMRLLDDAVSGFCVQ